MYFLRAGHQLGGAKAARAPAYTVAILGRRFILSTMTDFLFYHLFSL